MMFWFAVSTPGEVVEIPAIPSSVLIAIISVIGTLGAAYLMRRNRTQDTASWLITELRTEIQNHKTDVTEAREQVDACLREVEDLRAIVQEERQERQRLEALLNEREC